MRAAVYSRVGAAKDVLSVIDAAGAGVDPALAHNVAARRPLTAIAEAHELVEGGLVAGNVVVEL